VAIGMQWQKLNLAEILPLIAESIMTTSQFQLPEQPWALKSDSE